MKSKENSAFRLAWPNDLLSFSLHLACVFFFLLPSELAAVDVALSCL